MERQQSPAKQMLLSGQWVKSGKAIYKHVSGESITKTSQGWVTSLEPEYAWGALWVALERFNKVAA